jgi:hypothetical protein
MKGLLFMSRVALICNLCYFITIVGRRSASFRELTHDVESTIVVLGVVAVFVNIFVSIAWLISIAFKKKGIPIWLGIFNLIMFICQLLNMSILQL